MLISRLLLIFVDVVDYVCDAKLVIIFEKSYQILSKIRPHNRKFTIINNKTQDVLKCFNRITAPI